MQTISLQFFFSSQIWDFEKVFKKKCNINFPNFQGLGGQPMLAEESIFPCVSPVPVRASDRDQGGHFFSMYLCICVFVFVYICICLYVFACVFVYLNLSPADGCGSDRDQGGTLYCDGWWDDSTCCPTYQCSGPKNLPGSKLDRVFAQMSLYQFIQLRFFFSRQPNPVMAINCKICGFRETETLGFNLKGHISCGICRIVYL